MYNTWICNDATTSVGISKIIVRLKSDERYEG